MGLGHHAAVSEHLSQHLGDVPGVVEAHVVVALQLNAQLAEHVGHSGRLLLLLLVKLLIEPLDVDPLLLAHVLWTSQPQQAAVARQCMLQVPAPTSHEDDPFLFILCIFFIFFFIIREFILWK